MTQFINKETINLARAAHEAGDISGAYQILADAGDSYAKFAASITGGNGGLLVNTVRSLWENSSSGSLERWDSVAQQHQLQYLDLVGDDGRLPSTFEIEASSFRLDLTRFKYP